MWYWLAIHILAVQFYGFRDDLMEGLANILADKASLRRTPGFGFQVTTDGARLMCRVDPSFQLGFAADGLFWQDDLEEL